MKSPLDLQSLNWSDFPSPRSLPAALKQGGARLSHLFLRVCSVEHPRETSERKDGTSQELAISKSVKGREEEARS